MNVKEMKRGDMKKRFGWTDVLDPDGKPYLVQDRKGEFYILFWRAWFDKAGRWSGSDWYMFPISKKQRRFPPARVDVARVWQLPGIKYAPPTLYSHQQHVKVKDEKPTGSGDHRDGTTGKRRRQGQGV